MFLADVDEKDKTCSFVETWVWIWRKKFKKNFIERSDLSQFWCKGAKEKNFTFLIEWSFRDGAYSSEICMEGIQIPLLRIEYLTDDRTISKLKAVFGKFGMSWIRCVGQIKKFVDWIVPEEPRIVDVVFISMHFICSFWGTSIWLPR